MAREPALAVEPALEVGGQGLSAATEVGALVNPVEQVGQRLLGLASSSRTRPGGRAAACRPVRRGARPCSTSCRDRTASAADNRHPSGFPAASVQPHRFEHRSSHSLPTRPDASRGSSSLADGLRRSAVCWARKPSALLPVSTTTRDRVISRIGSVLTRTASSCCRPNPHAYPGEPSVGKSAVRSVDRPSSSTRKAVGNLDLVADTHDRCREAVSAYKLVGDGATDA